MITISLFYYCKKVFFLMNIWIVGKNSMKHYYLERNVYSHLNMEDITDSAYVHRKRVFQDFKIKNLEEYHVLYFKAIYCY